MRAPIDWSTRATPDRIRGGIHDAKWTNWASPCNRKVRVAHSEMGSDGKSAARRLPRLPS
jgi:hypothetical protein